MAGMLWEPGWSFWAAAVVVCGTAAVLLSALVVLALLSLNILYNESTDTRILPPVRLPLRARNQYLEAPTFNLGGTILDSPLQIDYLPVSCWLLTTQHTSVLQNCNNAKASASAVPAADLTSSVLQCIEFYYILACWKAVYVELNFPCDEEWRCSWCFYPQVIIMCVDAMLYGGCLG